MFRVKNTVLIILISFIGKDVSAQLFTEDIASIDMSLGAIYLPVFEDKQVQPSISVNATVAGNLYIGASAVRFTDAMFNLGYHLVNSERAILTFGYERYDFFQDQLKAQGLFTQLQIFSESDFTFLRIKGSYILNPADNWTQPVSLLMELGVRFDTGTGGFGRGYSRGSESWFPI
ncbi:MAG: hypothetical protein ACON5K_01950 [Bacteroidia bacterium]